jgi:hypothetical protein
VQKFIFNEISKDELHTGLNKVLSGTAINFDKPMNEMDEVEWNFAVVQEYITFDNYPTNFVLECLNDIKEHLKCEVV